MGVSMFEREKLERRVDSGPKAAIGCGILVALVLGYGWWTGAVSPLWVLAGLVYVGVLSGLALAAGREELPTRILGILTLLLVGAALVESFRRPLRFDILIWVGVIMVARSWLSARRLDDARDRVRD